MSKTPETEPLTAEQLVYYSRESKIGENYADRTNRLVPFRYANIQALLARFFLTAHYEYGIPNWREQCIGISSRVYQGGIGGTTGSGAHYHMPMFDYDGKNIRTRIREDVENLQEKWNLGDAWVYQTRRGYHVYFFTDTVDAKTYGEMLNGARCCKGFKAAAQRSNGSVLRVSAKYTEFDIEFLYMLQATKRHTRRPLPKAHVVQRLIRMGQESGTHFASLFPQWARYREDKTEWRPGTKKGRRKKRGEAQVIEIDVQGQQPKKGNAPIKGKRIRKLKANPTPAPAPEKTILAENQIADEANVEAFHAKDKLNFKYYCDLGQAATNQTAAGNAKPAWPSDTSWVITGTNNNK